MILKFLGPEQTEMQDWKTGKKRLKAVTRIPWPAGE